MATTAAPYGFWATNPTKKLAHWVYLLGQTLSRNRVFQNFSGEPPPPPPPPLKFWTIPFEDLRLSNPPAKTERAKSLLEFRDWPFTLMLDRRIFITDSESRITLHDVGLKCFPDKLSTCMQDTFARATHSARDDRVSCIQVIDEKLT